MPERRYGEQERVSGRIARVKRGSAAWRAGFRRGDEIVAVDGKPMLDVLDWQWATADGGCVVEVVRHGERRTLVLDDGVRSAGIEFEGVLFDGIRRCVNACSFCFVAQLPRGLRDPLYVRDDDYRLSFLHGNFITLTNLSDDDVARIIEQRLSPLYVSLHAAEPEIRRRLIAPRCEDRALERLDDLLAGGIEVHVQVVAVPGVNDGEVLHQTLHYLKKRENVASVGIVPLGFTKHQRRFTASYDARRAARLLALVSEHQAQARAARGVSWVHAADEFYLLAGEDFPSAEEYDGYPQYENGIGLVRSFVDEFEASPPKIPARGRRVILVTGAMFAPVLERLIRSVAGSERIHVLAVRNDFLGGNVGVAGLLSGGDIVRSIAADSSTGTYLVPDVVLNSDALTLDDLTVRDIGRRAAARVRVIGSTAADLAKEVACL